MIGNGLVDRCQRSLPCLRGRSGCRSTMTASTSSLSRRRFRHVAVVRRRRRRRSCRRGCGEPPCRTSCSVICAWSTSENSGSSSPRPSMASAARMPGPPALVSTATRRPVGSGWLARSVGQSNSSCSVFVRITPGAAKQRVDGDVDAGQRAGVRGGGPCSRRRTVPDFTTTIGFLLADPSSEASKAARVTERLHVQTMTSLAGSSSQYSSKSVGADVGAVPQRDECGDPDVHRRACSRMAIPSAPIGSTSPRCRAAGRSDRTARPADVGVGVEQTHAVGADQAHPVRRAEVTMAASSVPSRRPR